MDEPVAPQPERLPATSIAGRRGARDGRWGGRRTGLLLNEAVSAEFRSLTNQSAASADQPSGPQVLPGTIGGLGASTPLDPECGLRAGDGLAVPDRLRRPDTVRGIGNPHSSVVSRSRCAGAR